MESPSAEGSSPVTPRVWTRGVRTSPLVPLVSPQRVLQLATAPPVTWTAPFPLWFALSRVRRLLRIAAAASASSCARVSVSPAKRPPRAPLASPQPRRRVGCGYRASVSPHCLLRRELTSPELRYGHRRRGQGSVVHHFSSFLSQKLR